MDEGERQVTRPGRAVSPGAYVAEPGKPAVEIDGGEHAARRGTVQTHTGRAGLVCQASIAPQGATCAYSRCTAPADVRLVLREDGPAYDYCEVDWPHVTHSLGTRGQTVTDTTGGIWTIRAEFPQWDVWHVKVSGVYYALTSFGGEGVSVHAYLIGALRARMLAAQEERRSSDVPADFPHRGHDPHVRANTARAGTVGG